MSDRSELEMEKWNKIYDSYRIKGKVSDFRARFGAYKASLILGRDFQEPVDSYLKRKNLEKFMNWDPEIVNLL